MAKRAKIDENIFAKTDAKSKSKAQDEGRVITRGLGLSESKWQELEELAHELGLPSRHAMTAYAVKYFLKQYKEGKIEMPTQPTLPKV